MEYYVITNPRLEEYLHNKGFIPLLTTPVPNKRDVWKYTYRKTDFLLIEIDNYYSSRKEKKECLAWMNF